ncbi:HAD-like protein [Aspergillus cavernicola]|uniref:HAD-like protein n=1 Tax=Aspergillus cavernicola TaxID=176166 RepID=A0ABR4IZZ9_9EURO
MSTTQNKHVVFDVVGTLISYDAFFTALETRLGSRLKASNIGSRIFGYAWMEAGEKEYTYLSLSANYTPFISVFRSIFYRTLWQAGITSPRTFATDEDREFLISAYRGLTPRPGVRECFERLERGGYKVWCLTAGDVERVNGYLVSGGVEFPKERFVSCDEIGVGKPVASSYQFILDKFPKGEGEGAREMWFAAGHMWDAAGARQCGFKGAWVSFWEKEACLDIFKEMDVIAEDLPALADGIVGFSGKQ